MSFLALFTNKDATILANGETVRRNPRAMGLPGLFGLMLTPSEWIPVLMR